MGRALGQNIARRMRNLGEQRGKEGLDTGMCGSRPEEQNQLAWGIPVYLGHQPFVTTQPALKEASRSSRNGAFENANARREYSVRPSNYPT